MTTVFTTVNFYPPNSEEHAIIIKKDGGERGACNDLSFDHSRRIFAKGKEFYSANEVYVSLLVEGDG